MGLGPAQGLRGPRTGQVFNGSYTGDGSTSLAITGVGFRPSYVRIWRRETTTGLAGDIYETTAEILDDDADGMSMEITSQVTSRSNRIIAFGPDGFTLDDAGVDAHPNQNTVQYNFLCLGR